MTPLLSLGIWLGISLIMAEETPPSQQPQQSFRIFADLKHTGTLTGPLTASSPSPDEFGIAVPLPGRSTGRDRWPEKLNAEDQVVERLGRVRVETTPAAGDLVVSIESDSRRCLRLFRKAGGEWRRQSPNKNHSWIISPGKDGLVELGVGIVIPDVRPASAQAPWPRTFTVELSTKSKPLERMRVPFRVAPFVIPSALEPVDELLIVSQPITADSVRSVRSFAASIRLKLVAHEVDEMCDQWMQDTIEPGLFTFPTATGIGQARAGLSGLRKGSGPEYARLDHEVATWLRRQGVVTVAPGIPREQPHWNDWYGNIEATPPHTDRHGRRFPYGRVIAGKKHEFTMHPGVLRFLEAQGVQWPPIVVDTSWLAVGHVDEVVNFVPAKTKTGFKVLLPSPKAGRETLRALLAKGLEESPVFAATEDEMTLGALRMTVSQTSENLAIDEAVARLRAQLKTELNLEDSDFVMLPALFQGGLAVIPNPVNSVIVNGHLLVPKPLGPRPDEKDAFEQAIRAALAGCDVKVDFIDSWNAYHLSGGEIHCGTNTFRRLRDPAWWASVENVGEKGK
jgi:protein-arginine deiminase